MYFEVAFRRDFESAHLRPDSQGCCFKSSQLETLKKSVWRVFNKLMKSASLACKLRLKTSLKWETAFVWNQEQSLQILRRILVVNLPFFCKFVPCTEGVSAKLTVNKTDNSAVRVQTERNCAESKQKPFKYDTENWKVHHQKQPFSNNDKMFLGLGCF